MSTCQRVIYLELKLICVQWMRVLHLIEPIWQMRKRNILIENLFCRRVKTRDRNCVVRKARRLVGSRAVSRLERITNPSGKDSIAFRRRRGRRSVCKVCLPLPQAGIAAEIECAIPYYRTAVTDAKL